MKVYIPTRGVVENNIIESIKNQTISCDIELVKCDFDLSIDKANRIALSREKTRECAQKDSGEYLVFHDSDILNLYEDNIEVMLKFLQNHLDYGIVSLCRDYRYEGHIICSVMMIRRTVLNLLDFYSLLPNRPLHGCFAIMKSALSHNFKYDYVDEKVRIKHIE